LKTNNTFDHCFPDIAKQWNYEKNGDLTPSDVRPMSNKKVWWICSKGHEWAATIGSRASSGCGCPYCSGRKVCADNNLAVLHPELAQQWHKLKNGNLSPHDVRPRSSRKAWWKCKKGHEWESTIAHRTNGRGCPYCAGRKVGKDNNLAVLQPALSKQWHQKKNGNLTPHNVTQNSGRKVWWQCVRGHEWEARVADRSNGIGCPYCSGNKVGADNNLAVLQPVLVKQWNKSKNGSLTPYDVTQGARKKVWWTCEKGHEWEASIVSRVNGYGCPYCAGQKVGSDNNLVVLQPHLVAQWHKSKNGELTPFDVRPGSHKKVWWWCSHGHEWEAAINHRTNGSGCPLCSNQTSRLEIRFFCELKTVFPKVLWRQKIEGEECDVYLPGYLIGIEIDGYYWHKNKERMDRGAMIESGV